MSAQITLGAADLEEAGYVHLRHSGESQPSGALDESLLSAGDSSDRPLHSSALQGAPARWAPRAESAPLVSSSALPPTGEDMERQLEKRLIGMTRDMTDALWDKVLVIEERLAVICSDLDRLRRSMREGHAVAGSDSAATAGNEQLLKLQGAIEEMKSTIAEQHTTAAGESMAAMHEHVESLAEKLREDIESRYVLGAEQNLETVGLRLDSLAQKLREEVQSSCESTARSVTETAMRVAAESAEESANRAIDDALAKLLSEQKSTIESAVSRSAKVVEEAANRSLEERLADLRAEQQTAIEAAAESAARASLAAEEAAMKSRDDALDRFRVELESLHLEEDHQRAEQDKMFARLNSEFIPAAAELAMTQLRDECTALETRLEPRLQECEDKGFHLDQSIQSLAAEHGNVMRKQQEEHEGFSKALRQQLQDLEDHTAQELNSLQDSLESVGKDRHESELLGQRTAKGLEEIQIAVDSLERQAIPSLLSRAGMLEKRLSEELETLRAAHASNAAQVGAQCNQEVKRLANEVVDRLKEERRRNRDEIGALERRIVDASERWQSSCEQRQEAAEQRRVLLESRHGAQEQRHTLHEQRLAAHDEVLQRLAERCHELPRLLEAQVEAARASAKEDLTASALHAFRGELTLMQKVAQLSKSGAGVQPTASPPGYAWDGQSWQPVPALNGHALAPHSMHQVM